MKFRKSPLVNTTLRYGFIAGAMITVLMIFFYYLGQHPLLVSPYLDFRIVMFGVFVFFSLKEVREKHQAGVLYFWQGLLGSYLLVFVSMVIAGLGILFFSSIVPDFITSFSTTYTEYLQAFPVEEIEKLGRETYEEKLKAVQLVNGMQLAQSYFSQGIVIGLFVSVIMSAIMRKQPKTI